MQCSSFVMLAYEITRSDRPATTASNAGRIACRAIAARALPAKRVEIGDEQSKSCIRPPAWSKTRLLPLSRRQDQRMDPRAESESSVVNGKIGIQRARIACESNSASLLPELNEAGRILGHMLAIIWSSSGLPQRLCGEV